MTPTQSRPILHAAALHACRTCLPCPPRALASLGASAYLFEPRDASSCSHLVRRPFSPSWVHISDIVTPGRHVAARPLCPRAALSPSCNGLRSIMLSPGLPFQKPPRAQNPNSIDPTGRALSLPAFATQAAAACSLLAISRFALVRPCCALLDSSPSGLAASRKQPDRFHSTSQATLWIPVV